MTEKENIVPVSGLVSVPEKSELPIAKDVMNFRTTMVGFKINIRTIPHMLQLNILDGNIDNTWRTMTANRDFNFDFPARKSYEYSLEPANLFGVDAKNAILAIIRASDYSYQIETEVDEYMVSSEVFVREKEIKGQMGQREE